MVGLVDCNNFFVSCERSVRPELENKAVIVLSNNDGCAVARSNEAKALGVKMGQPAFQLRHLIDSGKLIALSGNHHLYHEISIKVHNIFRRFVPSTYDYSVDEAFLDVSGIPILALEEIAEKIHSACWIEEHIPVTVGFSHTRTLSKIATHIGKKLPTSICILDNKRDIRNAIEKLPIYELWGVGRRLTKKMYAAGINTISDFADLSINTVRLEYGVNGERTWNELHSIPCIEMRSRSIQDSISETRTFPSDTDDFEYILSRVIMFASDCASRLRQMNATCRLVTVFLNTNRFKDESNHQSQMVSICFEVPESATPIIAKAAEQALVKIFNSELKYKRAGVTLSDISSGGFRQLSLFETEKKENIKAEKRSLMSVIDGINDNISGGVILASQISDGLSPFTDNRGYSSTFHFQE